MLESQKIEIKGKINKITKRGLPVLLIQVVNKNNIVRSWHLDHLQENLDQSRLILDIDVATKQVKYSERSVDNTKYGIWSTDNNNT